MPSPLPLRHTSSTPLVTPTPSSRKTKAKGKEQSASYDTVPVKPSRHVYVVICGDHPGIYFDRNAAILKLGTSPGMKLALFDSLSQAAWYFVKQYMKGQVGVPVLVDDEDEDEDED
ncbi:hypothetical protein LXA43DRAFT_1103388 [Ganoderma leucocontextum]|nr:hypothetical protein LXA43DRAFT_1103388 [Ganoderma leucocontextum]